MTQLIVATDVAKSYGEGSGRVQAVCDVSLVLGPGVTAIVGPSGSGKTTLLHCLATIATPDTGRVLFQGRDTTAMSDDERSALRREAMGFVFQRGNLAPALTVAENAAVGLVLKATGRDETATRVTAALEAVGMADKAARYPAELSSGQLQRVALARAIAAQPLVLWADEPTGALDRAASVETAQLLQSIAAAGTAVVVVTHDDSVASAADAVHRIEDGRLVE